MRKNRFPQLDESGKQAELGRLVEQAPTLGKTKSTQSVAMVTAFLSLLALAGFYYTMKILEAAEAQRSPEILVEVDSAGEVDVPRMEALLNEVEANESKAEAEYQRQLEALKKVELESGEDG